MFIDYSRADDGLIGWSYDRVKWYYADTDVLIHVSEERLNELSDA